MKRILTLIISALILLPTAAGQSRLRFDGVAVRGNTMNVVNRLRARGWQPVEAADHIVTLTGRWVDTDSVTVMVIEGDEARSVTDIGVMVPCDLDWQDIQDRWERIVAAVSETWGAPEKIESRFNFQGEPTDGEKLVLIQTGRCRYGALWRARGGSVEASVIFVPYKYYILLKYALDPKSSD